MGLLLGAPVIGVRVVVSDGKSHSVDSSDMAFQTAARDAFKEVYAKARPMILEPVMKLGVEGPTEFQGAVTASLSRRMGMIQSSDVNDDGSGLRMEVQVPLANMFGYINTLRSMSSGRANFTMQFDHYDRVPSNISEEIQAKYDYVFRVTVIDFYLGKPLTFTR